MNSGLQATNLHLQNSRSAFLNIFLSDSVCHKKYPLWKEFATFGSSSKKENIFAISDQKFSFTIKKKSSVRKEEIMTLKRDDCYNS